jgi:hypothetical protein
MQILQEVETIKYASHCTHWCVWLTSDKSQLICKAPGAKTRTKQTKVGCSFRTHLSLLWRSSSKFIPTVASFLITFCAHSCQLATRKTNQLDDWLTNQLTPWPVFLVDNIMQLVVNADRGSTESCCQAASDEFSMQLKQYKVEDDSLL